MRRSLVCAQRALGLSSPNPAVGCVVVDASGRELACAHTGNGGRPHAEERALAQIAQNPKTAKRLRGATVYVTLEPCAHSSGRSASGLSCARSLVDAGVARVVIACLDCDPRSRNKGVSILRQAGVRVDVGLLESEAQETLAGFFSRISKQRPRVILKLASDPDGVIGSSVTPRLKITSQAAWNNSMARRSRVCAIMVGSSTLALDNPRLDCRLGGLKASSPAVVVLRSARIKSTLKSTIKNTTASTLHALAPLHGRRVLLMDQGLGLDELLRALAEQEINSLLVEGGATLADSFIKAGLVDQIIHLQSPEKAVCREPVTLPDSFYSAIRSMHKFDSRNLGQDVLTIYRPMP